MSGARTSYTGLQKLLHWTVALLLVVSVPLGASIVNLSDAEVKAIFGTGKGPLYFWHKSFGLLILMLMLTRLAARLVLGAPDYAAPLAPHERVLSRIVHWTLYALLLILPMLGWLGTSAFGPGVVDFFGLATFPDLIGKDRELSKTLFSIHRALAITAVALIALHVAAALMHGIVKRDGVLSRMIR